MDRGMTTLLESAAELSRSFAQEVLLPRSRELEKHGGAPSPGARPSQGVPLASLMEQFAERLGLAELAREAVLDQGANDAILSSPELGAAVLLELSRVNPGFALSFGASLGLCGQSILRDGTDAQRLEWARPVLSFEKLGCWAITEPGAGSDAFSMTTRARREGTGFVLSGEKCFITNAPIADTLVVYARVQESGPLDGQIRPFLLSRTDPGLSTSAPVEKMGMRSSPTGSIFLDEVRVPADRLLGDPAQSGKRSALTTLLGERAAIAAMSLAIIEESLRIALGYAKERVQFGQPIVQFQAVQLRLARMYAAQETVRALIDRGRKLVEQGEASIAFFCAAKYTASSLANEVALEGVQVLGGAGYCADYRVEGLARDAKLLEIGGGTSDIQLLAIARELIKA
jgi:alkylation response protein AidB-like acyl-CoA dehydrogenase